MSGRKSQDKGKRGEREVCKLLRRWFPDSKRSFGQSRLGGSECPDIIGGVEDHFYVEVKRYKTLSSIQLRGFWEKAKQDRNAYSENLQLVMIYREDREQWNVWFESNNRDFKSTMTWEKFSDNIDKIFEPVTQKGE